MHDCSEFQIRMLTSEKKLRALERQLKERERRLDDRERVWGQRMLLASTPATPELQSQSQSQSQNGLWGSSIVSPKSVQYVENEDDADNDDDVYQEEGPSPTDVLHLNVGGQTNIAVLRQTLTMMPNSLLASKFSGRWNILERDRDGNIFIDQPPELFLPLLNFLRAKSCETPSTTRVKPPTPTEDFLRMIEYYHLTLAVYQMEIVPLLGSSPSSPSTSYCSSSSSSSYPAAIQSLLQYPDFFVRTSEFCTFDLLPVRHAQAVHSFAVRLHRKHLRRAQIGWRRDSGCRDSTRLLLEGAFDQKGIGDVENTLSLDCCRGGILNDGSFIPLDNNRDVCQILQDESSITSLTWVCGNDKLELYVNDIAIDLGLLAFKTSGRNIPCFSIHGELTITSIKFKHPPGSDK